jgi:hypothetical protein
LFTDKGDLKVSQFSNICIKDDNENEENEEDNKGKTLADIIEENNLSPNFPKEKKYTKEKYKSVIDFPNFLLQVLKLKNETSLDDKKLIEQFSSCKDLKPKEFILDLLKYRTLFDKYIIKQDLSNTDESKQNWGIRKLEINQKEKAEYSLIKTFDQDEELVKDQDEELVKLQVMLYYSDSTSTNNKWLQEILQNNNCEDIKNYTCSVCNIAKEKFKAGVFRDNVIDCKKLAYPDIRIFDLYFIDFLLWKLSKEPDGAEMEEPDGAEMKYLKVKISNKKNLFNTFKFKQISSREHLLSQEHARRDTIEQICNEIGNLCLISASQNSKGNKENPSDKKKLFQNDNSSLKRLIMFESFENDKWGENQIRKHGEEIKNLINKYS